MQQWIAKPARALPAFVQCISCLEHRLAALPDAPSELAAVDVIEYHGLRAVVRLVPFLCGHPNLGVELQYFDETRQCWEPIDLVRDIHVVDTAHVLRSVFDRLGELLRRELMRSRDNPTS